MDIDDGGYKLSYSYRGKQQQQQQSYGYYNDVNVKPMSESSLLVSKDKKLGITNNKLALTQSEGVIQQYDFLGRPIDSTSRQNTATTKGMTRQNGKTYDFLGNLVDGTNNDGGSSSITTLLSGSDNNNGHVHTKTVLDNSELDVRIWQGTFNDKKLLSGSLDVVDLIPSQGIFNNNNDLNTQGYGSTKLYDNNMQSLRGPSNSESLLSDNALVNTALLHSSLHDSLKSYNNNMQSLQGSSNSESLLSDNALDNAALLRGGSVPSKPIGSFAKASGELPSKLNMNDGSIQSQLQGGKNDGNLLTTMDVTSNNKLDYNMNIMNNQQSSTAAQLNCEPHGGPSPQYSDEIVYWHNINKDYIPSSDASYTSPFYSKKSQEQTQESTGFWKTKYLTFEMDNSGFNNMRLGFENAVVMAHAMGRTLVLPPKRLMEHGLRDVSGRKMVSFSDFYDIAAINAKQSGLNIITMAQFLKLEAMNGNLKGQYPPDNRIEWDNQRLEPLWEYISNVTTDFDWHPNECVVVFPRGVSDGSDLQTVMDDIINMKDGRPFPNPIEFQGKPTRVDAPTIERLREALGG
eukprot:scaffold25992_cov23-Cyclotella_meneghiniana.AAC.1